MEGRGRGRDDGRGEHSGPERSCYVTGRGLPATSAATFRLRQERHPQTRRDVMASGWRWAIGGAVAAMLAGWAGPASAQSGAVKMEWLSWSIFRFTSPGGKIVVTNPFV